MISGAGIFPCPSCGEMIYSDARNCRFCSAQVDPGAAALGARLQAQVNTACNQAKMLRHSAVSMWVFFLVSLIFRPVEWAFLGFLLGTPFWLIYWQFTFGKLKTGDSDYEKAKRDRLIALYIWLPAPLLLLLLEMIG